MLISRTSQYAIQSLTYFATQEPGAALLSRKVAEHLQVPTPYFAKIMQTLSNGGLVKSSRGRLGGFCLREAPEAISIMRILIITEGQDFTKDCMLGLKECSDETACPMHQKWKPIKEAIIEMLNLQTLATLSDGVKNGKYRISDIPGVLMQDIVKH